MNDESIVDVVAAVIRGADGRVLLSLRAPHQEQGNAWEFPGGKSRPEESPLTALARELSEELGIAIHHDSALPLLSVLHRYPARTIRLEVFEVFRWDGTPRGCEGQRIEWVAPAELPKRHFPAANLPIITAACIPRICLVTAEPPAGDTEAFLGELECSLRAGVGLVQFRVKSLEGGRRAALAAESLELCRAHGASMLVNESLELAVAIGADGVHLTSRQLFAFDRRPMPSGRLLSAACHNPHELDRAGRLQVDFALLGPVLATASHPGTTPLGWHEVSAWVKAANFPVFALGGQSTETLSAAISSGCQGIAAISALWNRRTPLPDPRLESLTH